MTTHGCLGMSPDSVRCLGGDGGGGGGAKSTGQDGLPSPGWGMHIGPRLSLPGVLLDETRAYVFGVD